MATVIVRVMGCAKCGDGSNGRKWVGWMNIVSESDGGGGGGGGG